MEHLLRLILMLPLEKVAALLFFKNGLADEYKKDIFHSVLQQAMQEKKLSEQEAKEILIDPLTVELEKYNNAMTAAWYEQTTVAFGQDVRLDLLIKLVQLCELLQDKALLLDKIDKLNQLYISGYTANTLVSLYSSLMVAGSEIRPVNSEQKETVEEFMRNEVKKIIAKAMLTGVATRLQKNANTEETYNQIFSRAIAKYDFFHSILEKNGKACILLLYQLDYELKLYKKALEAFIESELRESKEELPVEEEKKCDSIRQFCATKPKCKKILALYEVVLLFQGCLYDKEKNALQRLELFRKVFIEQHKKLDSIKIINIDKTTKMFFETIVNMLIKYKTLFVSPATWRISLFAQSASVAIWGTEEEALLKSRADCEAKSAPHPP